MNRGVSNTTKYNRFRIVRAVWNKALVEGLVSYGRYPFNDFDLSLTSAYADCRFQSVHVKHRRF